MILRKIFFLFYFCLLSPLWSLSSPEKGQQIIEKVYEGLTGFNAHEEYEKIQKEGAAPTYGEILYSSVETLLSELNLTSEDVFYDLGSGIGKCVMQVYLRTPVKKSVGIEISEIRHAQALQALEKLKATEEWDSHRSLVYIRDNFLRIPLQDATVVFLCSTCFSDELMENLTQVLSRLKPGLRVLTLKALPENPKFKFIKNWQLPMTWSQESEGSIVYLYQLEK